MVFDSDFLSLKKQIRQMEKQNKPEVTVAVIAYNSSKTVIQTLESIKAQTYDQIRLIVSDDCSTDDTVNICNRWIKKNADLFLSAEIINSSTNTGVTGNCNRAWDACKTEFFKIIAADDYLLPDCIGNNVIFMENNPSSTVVFSKMSFIGKRRYVRRHKPVLDYSIFSLPVEEQHKRLLEKNSNPPAPTCFFRIQSVRDMGIRFDERIPFMEDWPMWIMLTEKGVKLDFLDKETVGYRIGGNGLSAGKSVFGVNFYKSLLKLDLIYLFDHECQTDKGSAINSFTERQASIYQEMLRRMRKTPEYRVGRFLLAPWRFIEKLFPNS